MNKALLESKLFRWRLWHGFVAALLVAAVLAVGLPSTQTWRPVQLWAAPTKDVPALRIHGGSLTGILRSRLDNWSRIESDSWDKVLSFNVSKGFEKEMLRGHQRDGFPWKRSCREASKPDQGPEAPSRMLHWVPRVCTDRYEGPKCSNTTRWKGIAAGQSVTKP